MIEDGIRGGINRYAKPDDKYMKDYDKNKESSNNLYGWAMSQKLPVNGFKWKKDTSAFIEEFIKNYDENSDKGYILKVDDKYPKYLLDLHSDLPFLPERMKINKCNKLLCTFYDKKATLFP